MKTNTEPRVDQKNPPAVHEWTGPTGVRFRDVRSARGTYYHDTTPPDVVRALDAAMESRARVRLFLVDSVTGRDWGEEKDVTGRVGRSTGWKKTALLIPTERSTGGPAILADCVVRLVVAGREVYRHQGYSVPTYLIRPIGADDTCGRTNLRAEGYTHSVARTDGGADQTVANFKSEAAAVRWVKFMRGERGCK